MSAASDALDQLDQQQKLLTDSLKHTVVGSWVGFPSLQANLEALSPGIVLDPHPPVLTSEGGEPVKPPYLASFDPNTAMPSQLYDWTCSACALDWVLRATQMAPGHTRDQAVEEIGYTHNINPTYGLMDASGSALRAVYDDYGIPTHQAWLTFDQVFALVGHTTGQMSGGAWYHWVALRGRDGGNLWIANSAPGYMGVWDTLTREQFNALGPFSVVVLG